MLKLSCLFFDSIVAIKTSCENDAHTQESHKAVSLLRLLPRIDGWIFTDCLRLALSHINKRHFVCSPKSNNQTKGETAVWAWCLKAIAHLYFELVGFHQYNPHRKWISCRACSRTLALFSLSSFRLCYSLPSLSTLCSLTCLAISLLYTACLISKFCITGCIGFLGVYYFTFYHMESTLKSRKSSCSKPAIVIPCKDSKKC